MYTVVCYYSLSYVKDLSGRILTAHHHTRGSFHECIISQPLHAPMLLINSTLVLITTKQRQPTNGSHQHILLSCTTARRLMKTSEGFPSTWKSHDTDTVVVLVGLMYHPFWLTFLPQSVVMPPPLRGTILGLPLLLGHTFPLGVFEVF